MKRLLLSLLMLIGVVTPINTINEAFAEEENVTYTTLGPGSPNLNSSPEDLENFNENNYKLSYRGDYVNDAMWMMFFPHDNDYVEAQFNQDLVSSNFANTDFDKIKIYTDKESYITAQQIRDNNSIPMKFNLFSDLCLNFSICFTNSGIKACGIYKVVIEEGFIYPSVNQNNKFIQKETQTFISSRYNKPSFNEIYSEWEVVKNFTSTENIPISICSGNLKGNYLAHIRDEAGHDQPDDSDKGLCILILFFDMFEYNPEIRNQSSITVSNLYLDKYNFLDKIKCVPNGGTIEDAITMREVTQGKDEFFYNKWGEYSSIGFRIGNGYAPSTTNYNGLSWSDIIIEKGCEFPAFASTNGDSNVLIKYVQTQTVTIHNESRNANFNVRWSLNFELGITEVLSVSTTKLNEVINNRTDISTYVVFSLSKFDEDDFKEYCSFISKNFLRKVYVNGHALKILNKDIVTHAFYNISGPNTFGFKVNGYEPDEINEIIIRNACPIPGKSNSLEGFDDYGVSNSYETENTVSFSKINGEFRKDQYITWTLFFDGGNPIRIRNREYFYSEMIPEGVSTEDKIFQGWLDPSGLMLEGDHRVIDSVEYEGKYLTFNKVTLVNGKKSETFKVEHNTRLLDIKTPKKSGYIFQYWTTEDGEYFNIDNKIVDDITLYAYFIKKDGGCSGNIYSTSYVISLLSIAAISLYFINKKRESL